ncbi:hypothetical protein TWF696_001787 [Orbilia brochopaga]|uniref:Uncharacterized protein n=1 Tax=Orbilia brochopaga TaxID=3140254 RepID=A0AAV9U8X5_9PEZI
MAMDRLDQARALAQADLLRAIMAQLPAKLAAKHIELSPEGKYVYEFPIKGSKSRDINIEGRLKTAVKECAKSIEFDFPNDVDEAVRSINRSRSGSVASLLSNASPDSESGDVAVHPTDLSGSTARNTNPDGSVAPGVDSRTYEVAEESQRLSGKSDVQSLKHAGNASIRTKTQPGRSSPGPQILQNQGSVNERFGAHGSSDVNSQLDDSDPKAVNRQAQLLADSLESHGEGEVNSSAGLRGMFSNMFRQSPGASPIPSPVPSSPRDMARDVVASQPPSPGSAFSFGRFLSWTASPPQRGDASPGLRVNLREKSQAVALARNISPALLPEKLLSNRLDDLDDLGSEVLGKYFHSQTTRTSDAVPSSGNVNQANASGPIDRLPLNNPSTFVIPEPASDQAEGLGQLHDQTTSNTLVSETGSLKILNNPESESEVQYIPPNNLEFKNDIAAAILKPETGDIEITGKLQAAALEGSLEPNISIPNITSASTIATKEDIPESDVGISRSTLDSRTSASEINAGSNPNSNSATNESPNTNSGTDNVTLGNLHDERFEDSLDTIEFEAELPQAASTEPILLESPVLPSAEVISKIGTEDSLKSDDLRTHPQIEQTIVEPAKKILEDTPYTKKTLETTASNISPLEANDGSTANLQAAALLDGPANAEGNDESSLGQIIPQEIAPANSDQEQSLDTKELDRDPPSDVVQIPQLKLNECASSAEELEGEDATTSLAPDATENQSHPSCEPSISHINPIASNEKPPNDDGYAGERGDSIPAVKEVPVSNVEPVMPISQPNSESPIDALRPLDLSGNASESVNVQAKPSPEIQELNSDSQEEQAPIEEETPISPSKEQTTDSSDAEGREPSELKQDSASTNSELQCDENVDGAPDDSTLLSQGGSTSAPLSPALAGVTLPTGLSDQEPHTNSTDRELDLETNGRAHTGDIESPQTELKVDNIVIETQADPEAEPNCSPEFPTTGSCEENERCENSGLVDMKETPVLEHESKAPTTPLVEKTQPEIPIFLEGDSVPTSLAENEDISKSLSYEETVPAISPLPTVELEPGQQPESRAAEVTHIATETQTLPSDTAFSYHDEIYSSLTGADSLESQESGGNSQRTAELKLEESEDSLLVENDGNLMSDQQEHSEEISHLHKVYEENTQKLPGLNEDSFSADPSEPAVASEPSEETTEASESSQNNSETSKCSEDTPPPSPRNPHDVQVAVSTGTNNAKVFSSHTNDLENSPSKTVSEGSESLRPADSISTIEIDDGIKFHSKGHDLENLGSSSHEGIAKSPQCEDLVLPDDTVGDTIPTSIEGFRPSSSHGLGISIPEAEDETSDLVSPVSSSEIIKSHQEALMTSEASGGITSQEGNKDLGFDETVPAWSEIPEELPLSGDVGERTAPVHVAAEASYESEPKTNPTREEGTQLPISQEWSNPLKIDTEDLLPISDAKKRNFEIAPPTPRADIGAMPSQTGPIFERFPPPSNQTPPPTPNVRDFKGEPDLLSQQGAKSQLP